MNGRRVFLLGLDGATFDLLRPWAEAGHLPHLARLMREGVTGELESTRPPTTAPAWAACVTGVNPGKHGVFDFRESPLLDPRRPLISGRSVRAPRLWHILNRHGWRTGLLNVPITYPPEPLDGFVVSGMMTPSAETEFTYPKPLKAELLRAVPDYVINLDIPQYDVELEKDALAFLRDVNHMLATRRAALFYLMDSQPWDFFMAVFVVWDRIQHLFWKYLDPGSHFYNRPLGARIRERVIQIFRATDEMLGELMSRLPEDASLFVVSDHGFGSTHAWFNANRWLAQQGYLKVKPVAQLRKSIFHVGMVLNDSPLVKRLVPKGLQSALRGRIRKTRSTFKSDLEQCIDWSRTRAFFASIPCQGIYINVKRDGVGTVEPGAEYEALRAEIAAKLKALTDPETGQPLVDIVQYREEVYHGPYAHLAPDILFVAGEYSTLGRQLLGPWRVIETSENAPNGFHRMNGIFMAWGKGIKRGTVVEGASIVDVTPTILHAMGLPVPAYMDGRVLTEIMDEAWLAEHPVVYDEEAQLGEGEEALKYSAEETEAIMSRLAALGYVE